MKTILISTTRGDNFTTTVDDTAEVIFRDNGLLVISDRRGLLRAAFAPGEWAKVEVREITEPAEAS